MNFSPEQKYQFYAELSKLTGAGFSIVDAADAMLDNRLPPAQKRYLEGLKAGVVDQNLTIAQAIDGIQFVPITPLERSIIDAAEKGGKISEGFEHLADYFQMMHHAARRVRSGMIYPIVLLHAGVLLPGLVKIVQAVDKKAAILQTLAILFGLYAIAAILFYVFRKLVRTASTSAGVDGFLRKIPVVSKVRRSLSMSRFCKVMQIHLLAGQRMDTSLTAAAEASQSGQILDSVIHQVVPAVKSGDHAGGHFNQKIFQPSFVRSYKTAEEAGTLDTDMERWSKASHGEAVLAMDRLSAVAPKILYGLVVIYIVYQIFGMFSGYLKAITNLL